MSKRGMRLKPEEVERFLIGRKINAFDPSTRSWVASVKYDAGGFCTTKFKAGGGDEGRWGISGDTYWTQYRMFRDGSKNIFFLKWVAADLAQAYFENGSPAFLQSGSDNLDSVDDC